jgi:hypothetical protein
MPQPTSGRKKGSAMESALRTAIEEDLFNELRWLLCAATEWDAYDKLMDEPSQLARIQEPCYHLKVYTMDSALLHARSLYEFFTATKQTKKRRTWWDYSRTAGQTSAKYDDFRKPLHGRVMHLNKDRSGYKEIKKEVVNLAIDILKLWNKFSEKPGLEPYANLFNKYRDLAIAEAESVAERYKQYGFRSPFSLKVD